jgi:adenylate cyclase
VSHPSLALLVALAATDEQAKFGQTQLMLGDRQIPLDLGLNMPLRFIGAAGSLTTLSAKGLLDGPMPDELMGKVVVLGYTASATGDRFATPFDDSTPGVEIIATAISQLIGGPTLRRDGQVRKWDAAHAIGLTLLCFLAVIALPLSRGIPVALALLCLSMISVTVLFAQGLWMSAALPLAAAIPPMMFAGVMRYTRERKQARKSEQAVVSLRRFQSPALAAKIESNPEYLATPVERDLVILFVDLTGFTGLSQRLGADGTRNLLRLFHALTTQMVEAQSGSVFNYMGDGALAVFGLDATTTSRAADNALTAAFNLARTLSEQRLAELPDEQLGCRIGLHRGAATLSRLGADSHQQVTVTGDSVNLASRLMEVAKAEQAVIVASSDFADALTSAAKSETAQLTEVPIRGRTGTVQILAWTRDVIANTV